jgi:hypothetical protein
MIRYNQPGGDEKECTLAVKIIWTDYMQYRARVRGFDLEKLEQIVLHSAAD